MLGVPTFKKIHTSTCITIIQCMYAFTPEVTIPEFKISNKSHKLLLVGEGEMDNNIMVRG